MIKISKGKVKSIYKTLSIFISGFIVALFTILIILLIVMNKRNGNSYSTFDNDSLSMSEPISSDNNTSYNTSINSYIDPYTNEKAIINNLLVVAKEFEDTVIDISTISYDEDYLYLSSITSDEYLYVMKIELVELSVDELLESLITSTSDIEVISASLYSLDEVPTIDITSLDVFKNNPIYKDYTYHNKYHYYIDNTHQVVGLSSLGYKDNSYISLIHVRYDIINEELITDPIDGFNSLVSDSDNEYYKVLDYLYHRM